jgi:lysozyme family protein
MIDLGALKAANAHRWEVALLTRATEFARPARIAFANKDRYVSIAKRCKMPDVAWLFIAVAHYRESAQDFSTNLAQGDPFNRVSVHVPAGRGPFMSFEDAAVDALVNCAPHAARLTDWSIAGMLTNLERYNGLGYFTGPVTRQNGVVVARYPSQPSPYIWAGTDQYRKGKYVRDGFYDPNAVDKQLGCAGLILAIIGLDPSIKFDTASLTKPDLSLPPLVPTAILDGAWLQTALNKHGASLIVDGIVGPDTRTAIRAFQASHGLAVDGIAGPATIAALKAVPSPVKPASAMAEPAKPGFWVSLFGRK